MEQVVSEKKRYKYLDIIKMIAIFFVVSYHSFSRYIVTPNNPDIASNINYIISIIFATCVPLFFMVNGALLFNKEFNLKKHLIKIIKTFLLIYFWATILTLLLMPVRGILTFKEFVKTVLTLKNPWINHLWFLSQLVLLYIIFPLLKYLFDKDKKYFIIFLAICFFFTIGSSVITSIELLCDSMFGEGNFLSSALSYGNSFLSKYDPTIKRYSYSMVYFMVGGVMHYFAQDIKDKYNKKWVVNILSIVAIIITTTYSFFYCKNVGIKDVVWDGYSLIFTFLNCCLVFLMGIVNDNGKDNKAITFISSHIMGIYIIHYAINPYLLKLFQTFVNVNEYALRFPVAIINIAISFLITFVLLKIKYVRSILKL